MPLIEFDSNLYLRGPGVGAGDFKRRERHDVSAEVAERVVRNGDAHYVDGVKPPAKKAKPTHPFVVAANVLRQQPTAEITQELLDVNGVTSDAPVTESELSEETTDATTTEPEPASDPLGAGSDDPAVGPKDPEPARNACSDCDKGPFPSAAALASHRRAKH